MVEDRLSDGRRIAELLSSELTGHGGSLAPLAVVDAEPEVEPTPDGSFAYAVAADGVSLAELYVQPDRARVEFVVAPDAAAAAGEAAGLRTRPKAVRPPRTLVFVEDGAQVKRVLPVFEAVLAANEADDPDGVGNSDGAGDSGETTLD